ncbi:MAG: metallophosphoesterase family protein [Chloroflexota bacterium]
MLIGVVSDTHLPRFGRALPPRLMAGLRGVDLILHAGDLTEMFVLDLLREIAPVEAVHGNVDGAEVLWALPNQRVVEVGGKRIGLTHGHGMAGSTPSRARQAFAGSTIDVVVFGHSHTPYNEEVDGLLLFNPGSPTDRRRQPRPSFGILRVHEGKIEAEIIHL